MKTELHLRQNPDLFSFSVSLSHFHAYYWTASPYLQVLTPERLWSAFIRKWNARVSCHDSRWLGARVPKHIGQPLSVTRVVYACKATKVIVAALDNRQLFIYPKQYLCSYGKLSLISVTTTTECPELSTSSISLLHNLSLLPLCLSSHSFPSGFPHRLHSNTPTVPGKERSQSCHFLYPPFT